MTRIVSKKRIEKFRLWHAPASAASYHNAGHTMQ